MADIITLSCPNCSAKLVVRNSSVKQFLCNTCGHEYLIKREGGVTYLEDIEFRNDISEEKKQTNSSQGKGIKENIAYEVGLEYQPKEVDDESLSTELPLINITKSDPSSDDKNYVKQIDVKISKLQIQQAEIQRNLHKTKVTYTIICLITMVICYALLPVFDSFNDLFLAIAVAFGSIILVFIIFFHKYKKSALSNQNYIETIINNLQNEMQALKISQTIYKKN